MRMADQAVDISNPYLLSDLAVCAELAMATVRASLYNIRVNLPAITDVKQRKEIETRCEKQLARATKTIQRVIPRIWERVSKAQK
jgi:formiminotetrahydrofolate cyclodeaminase